MQQVQRELNRIPHKPLKCHVGWMRPNQAALDLKVELLQFAEYVNLRDCERDCRRRMLDGLEEAVKIVFPHAYVHTFGSYAAGLSIFQSDIDVSIHTATNPIAAKPTHAVIDLTGSSSSAASRTSHVDLTASDDETVYEEDIVKGGGKSNSSGRSLGGRYHGLSTAIVSALTDSAGIGAEEEISWSLDYSASERVGALSFSKKRKLSDADGSECRSSSSDEDDSDSPAVNTRQFEFNSLKPIKSTAPSSRFPSSSSGGGRRGDEAVKREVLKSLRSTYDFVRTLHWVQAIELRARAKVPIINLAHRCGVECDISFGLAADDTTAVVQALRDKAEMRVFYPVSSFLKVFLASLDLDKPFTGGLGSFKLYVMVAWIVETISCSKRYQLSKELGGEEIDVGIVLFFFFKYFGNPEFLNINTKITTKSKVEITLAQTQQVVSIQRAFSRAYKVLEAHSSKSDSLGSEFSPSQLGKLLDCAALMRARSQALDRCRAFPLLSAAERDVVAASVLLALQEKARHGQRKSGESCRKPPDPAELLVRIKRSHPHFFVRLRAFASAGDLRSQLARPPAIDVRREQHKRKSGERDSSDGLHKKKKHKSSAYGLLGGVVGQAFLNGGKKNRR